MRGILAYMDDERTVENSVQLRQAQGVFPSVFGRGIFQLIDMLEDEEIIDTGAIGMQRNSSNRSYY